MTLAPSIVATQGAVAAGGFTSHANSSIPLCSRLVVATGASQGAGGTGTLVILVANAGQRCELKGYPKVEFFSARGVAIDTRDLHQNSAFYAEPKPRTVVLATNGVASVGLSWGDNPVDNQTCKPAAWSNITLPLGAHAPSYSPAVLASPCGGYLIVTPLEAGPVPVPNG